MLLYVPTTVGYIFLNNPQVTSYNASYVIHTKNKCPICTSVTTELPKKETTSWCPSLVRQCLKLIVSLPQRTTTTAQPALKNTGPLSDKQLCCPMSTGRANPVLWAARPHADLGQTMTNCRHFRDKLYILFRNKTQYNLTKVSTKINYIAMSSIT